MITFRKSNRNSPVLQQMLKMLPSWPSAVGIPAEHVLYFLEFLKGNCWNLTACTQRTPDTNFLVIKREFVNKSWILCTAIPAVLRIHLHVRQPVDQLLHRIQTEETDYRNVFLQPDHVPSKHQLSMSYTVAIITILWPFVQTFSKHSSLQLRHFLRHFPADSYLKYSSTKTNAVKQRTSVDACCYITEGQKCLYEQQIRWFIPQVCYRRQLKLHSGLKTVRESLHGRIIRHGLWPLNSADVIPCCFYMRARLKGKVYKTIPHTLEARRNNIRREISTISFQELQRVNNMLRRYTDCTRSGRQHFQYLL
jgi:hypothetical protein